jgi:membrane protein
MEAWLKTISEQPWIGFFIRLYQRYERSETAVLASALAYYAAFSLGPLLILLTGIAAVLLRRQPAVLNRYQAALTDLVQTLLPVQENAELLAQQSLDLILDQLSQGTFLRSLISAGILLWASSNFFTFLQLALERIFSVPHIRAYWRKRLLAFLLVVGVTLIIATQIIGSILLRPLIQLWVFITDSLNQISPTFPTVQPPSRDLFIEGLQLAIAIVVYTLCFRYLPRDSSRWLGAFIGALVSTTGIVMTRYFLATLFNFERFNLIYGIVTSLLIVLFWLYLAIFMFLMGANVAAELSHKKER